MANEKRLIELGEALRMVQNSKDDCPEISIKGRAIWETAHNCALSCLTSCPTVDAVEVEDKELLKAIKMLIKQYEHSKRSDYVHSPVAHALFHTWKKVDGDGNADM